MAADEKSECTRGVCAKRSRFLEVDCDGAVAHCSVTLISKVDSCGLLVGVLGLTSQSDLSENEQ